MSMRSRGGIILTGGNRITWRKTCPSATLSTTNLTWTDQGANPCLRGLRPATNHLSHRTAWLAYYSVIQNFPEAIPTADEMWEEIILRQQYSQHPKRSEPYIKCISHNGPCQTWYYHKSWDTNISKEHISLIFRAETLVTAYSSTWRNLPDQPTMTLHRSGKLKSHSYCHCSNSWRSKPDSVT
jgi:hypothetical protein